MRQKKEAFTLIELLIVVAIIGILAAIAIPNFLEAQTRAKVSRAKADIRSMVTALETYRVDNNAYPNGQMNTGDPPHYSYNNVVPHKYFLTTPVAYMSSIPVENPFGPFNYGHFDPHQLRHGYSYMGGAIYQEWSMPGGAWDAAGCDPWLKSRYLWFSIGPMRVLCTAVTGRFVAYDPTNGTISLGDIQYVGGPKSRGDSFQ